MAEEKKEKEAEKAPADPKAAAAGAKKGGKLMLIILPIAGAVLGIGASFAIPKPNQAGVPKEVEKPEDIGMFTVPDIKANLQRSGGLHYAMMDMCIVFKSRDVAKVNEHLGLKAAEGGGGHGGAPAAKSGPEPLSGIVDISVRDRILLLFSAKSIEDLDGREKKELLRKEIQSEIEPILFPHGEAKIDAVLVRNFLIQ